MQQLALILLSASCCVRYYGFPPTHPFSFECPVSEVVVVFEPSGPRERVFCVVSNCFLVRACFTPPKVSGVLLGARAGGAVGRQLIGVDALVSEGPRPGEAVCQARVRS